ncbi:MAG TPA: spore coat protein [Peptococcaceae bacterium]|nr:spore coat protein [Peptococcaceae bacterium]
MRAQSLSLHEKMEIQELLQFKTACLNKSTMMKNLVQDQDLKTLLEKDVQQATQAVSDLNNLLANSPGLQ